MRNRSLFLVYPDTNEYHHLCYAYLFPLTSNHIEYALMRKLTLMNDQFSLQWKTTDTSLWNNTNDVMNGNSMH
jgi:hypothetical protein